MTHRPVENAALNRVMLRTRLDALPPLTAFYTCLNLSGWGQGELGRHVGLNQQAIQYHIGKVKAAIREEG